MHKSIFYGCFFIQSINFMLWRSWSNSLIQYPVNGNLNFFFRNHLWSNLCIMLHILDLKNARFVMRSAFSYELWKIMYLLLLFADVNIETPPSMHPCKRLCDITGYEVL